MSELSPPSQWFEIGFYLLFIFLLCSGIYFIFAQLKKQFMVLLPGESVRYEEEDLPLEIRNASSGTRTYTGVAVRITNMRILIGFGKISKRSVRLYQSLRYVDEVKMDGVAGSRKGLMTKLTDVRIEKSDISYEGNVVHIKVPFMATQGFLDVVITVKNVSLFKSAIV